MTQVRNIPHAEIQAMWLLDKSLSIQFSHGKDVWGDIDVAQWTKDVDYRLVKKSPTVTKYHVAYVNTGSGQWIVTRNAAYTSVEDFYISNESLRGTKAELIQASAVQSEESVEVVFVSLAK